MPDVIEQLVIGLAFGKVDTSNLDKAEKIAKEKAKSAEQAYKDAAKEVERAQEAVRNASDKTARKVASDALHAARKSAKAAREAMQEAKAAAREAEKAGAAAAKKADDMEAKFGAGLKKVGGALGALGVGVSVAAIASMTQEVIQNSQELTIWSERLGETTDALQGLSKTGELAKVPQESLFKAIQKLQVGLGEFQRTGAGPAGEALKELGLNVEDLIRLPAEEQLRRIADGLTRVSTDAERTAILVKLVGEEGAQLAPLLSKGASGFDTFADAAARSGALTEEQIAKNVALGKEITELDQEWQTLKNTLVSALVPAINDSIDDFSNIGSAIGDLFSTTEETTTAVDENATSWVDWASTMALIVIPGALSASIAIDKIGDALEKVGDRIPGAVAAARAQVQAELAPEQQRVAAAQKSLDAQYRTLAESAALPSNAFFELTPVEVQDPEANAKNDRKKRRGGGRSGSRAERAAREAISSSPLGDELRRLAEEFGAGQKAVAEAIKAAAGAQLRGANQAVVRRSALSSLGGNVGQDLTQRSTKDPLLSEIFGVEGIPDVPLSELTQNRTPQVLTAQITNTFTIAMDFDIQGGSRPDLIPDRIVDGVTEVFRQIEQASRFVSIPFDR